MVTRIVLLQTTNNEKLITYVYVDYIKNVEMVRKPQIKKPLERPRSRRKDTLIRVLDKYTN